MRKKEIDLILATMLESFENVSDLNFTVGKPPQVESAGELKVVPFEDHPLLGKPLTPFQTEVIALNLINADRRLTENLVNEGYCDLSYSLPGRARFRVNIFQQRNQYSIVLRKLSTRIPTIAELKISPVLAQLADEQFLGVFFRFVLFGRAGQELAGLDVEERRRHGEELARGVHIEFVYLRHIRKILRCDFGNENVLNVHFRFFDQMQQ